MKEENDIDIEELQALLGIENKSNEIGTLFSSQNNQPKSFLQAVSLISNSNQFYIPADNPISQPQKEEIQNIIKNCSLFYSLENKDKFKIDFSKAAKKPSPGEDSEIITKETKDPNQNKNNNKNNQNNQNKDDKTKKQKNI